ncbi:unnamed protein product [Orchesella dallaii]|uniref:DUF4789 domain-containing protein n=1 Tax=Orchesella dallaii TaxID=48710 RepID=A0ABP1RHA1_9HEXA
METMKMFRISFEFLFLIAIFLSHSHNLVAEEHDRIVTDLELIYSSQGIPIDYGYNETKIEKEELASAPGCPKSIEGFPWVYYGNPPKCYLTGLQSPCSKNQLLFLEEIESESNTGVCVCKICQNYLASGAPMPVSPDGRYKFCGEDNVYDTHEKDCYDLHNQGSCGASQWLVKDSSGSSVTCIPGCLKSEEEDKVMKYNHQKGECVLKERPPNPDQNKRTQTYGLTPNSCPSNQRYSSVLKRCFIPNQIRYLGIIG